MCNVCLKRLKISKKRPSLANFYYDKTSASSVTMNHEFYGSFGRYEVSFGLRRGCLVASCIGAKICKVSNLPHWNCPPHKATESTADCASSEWALSGYCGQWACLLFQWPEFDSYYIASNCFLKVVVVSCCIFCCGMFKSMSIDRQSTKRWGKFCFIHFNV